MNGVAIRFSLFSVIIIQFQQILGNILGCLLLVTIQNTDKGARAKHYLVNIIREEREYVIKTLHNYNQGSAGRIQGTFFFFSTMKRYITCDL